jgi:predicted signal transduction protein with EAL and GGDEF domain
LSALSDPYCIQGNEIRTGASVGIAVYGPDSHDAETLLSGADVALYRAKSEGRGTYRYFTDAMDAEVRRRVSFGTDLRDAIGAGQLVLMYQPQVDVETQRIVGVEALVRWNHPTRGQISPSVFIPIAETSGLIVALGHWVLHEACSQAKKWFDAGIDVPLIGVNVSGLQFKTPHELEDDIAAVLAETNLPPEVLELELTESALMTVSREHSDVLERLRKAGVRIAIDDFGTGYSSLEYLGRLPVNRVKIAQSFVVDMKTGSRSATIVKAAIGLAHELRLDVVVEGVETSAQLALIRSWNCRKVQGFYYFKPLNISDATEVLRAGKVQSERPRSIEDAA